MCFARSRLEYILHVVPCTLLLFFLKLSVIMLFITTGHTCSYGRKLLSTKHFVSCIDVSVYIVYIITQILIIVWAGLDDYIFVDALPWRIKYYKLELD